MNVEPHNPTPGLLLKACPVGKLLYHLGLRIWNQLKRCVSHQLRFGITERLKALERNLVTNVNVYAIMKRFECKLQPQKRVSIKTESEN